jgi:hypothetical protein
MIIQQRLDMLEYHRMGHKEKVAGCWLLVSSSLFLQESIIIAPNIMYENFGIVHMLVNNPILFIHTVLLHLPQC